MQAHLRDQGIETLIHFPVPIPRQPAMAGLPASSCPVADQVCDEVFSLPLHPALADSDVDRVVAAVHAFRATAAGR
jgi:dTDP-4-amino-4,6-dideoxygalactose transaminase